MDDGTTAEVILRLLDFVERTSDLVGIFDADGRVVYMNQAAQKRLGYSDIAGLTAADVFDPGVFERYYDDVRPQLLRTGKWSGDASIRTQAGESVPIWFELIADVAPGGEITGMVGRGRPREVTDPAREVVERQVGCVQVRVRGLRNVVATHGDFVADGLMRAAARRLTLAVRASDVVVRVGDDAFVIVLEHVRDIAEVLRQTQALQDVFDREPVWTAAGEVAVELEVRPAIGKAGDTFEGLLARVESELINDLSTVSTETKASEGKAPKRGAMQPVDAALRLAVLRGEIRTHVVPVVDRDGDLAGFDAFGHWAHPAVGRLEASPFYELADRVPGVRQAVDLRVLREAAAVAATSPGTVAPRVYASIGASLLNDVYVEQYVWEIVDATGLSADRVHLIIGRALAADGRPKIRDTLQALRDNGYVLVVATGDDDAPVEALVHEFQAAEVRLFEGAIGRAIGDNRFRVEMERLVTAVHRAGAHVIAGGVDTQEERRAALELGVDLVTGAAYGDSVPADSII
jgi:EAL domain-containing protein (putative c-di-GMP-specific phosphodiesterase class I)/GGDEF domain-containing protein